MAQTDQRALRSPPLTGAYYWIPTATQSGRFSWSLLTCHDLNLWDGISHREFWPFVLERLASAWGFGPRALHHLLDDHYYALPRGRITNHKGRYWILHGKDSPVPEWKKLIIDRFHLGELRVKTNSDEHERVLSDDLLALEEALGIELDIPRV